MKNTFTLLVLFLCLALEAQTVLYSEDFESFNVGDGIAQSTDEWSTWSGAAGGVEDCLISDFESSSGTQALRVTTNQDVLFSFADQPLTSGRYKIEMKLLLPTNRWGYFNLLNQFDGSNSIWATQTYLRPNASSTVDAGEVSAASFETPVDQWLDVTYIVDLDNDFSTMYIQDNEEVISWAFSAGTGGGGNLRQLDAFNLYGWGQEGPAELFVDDFKVTEMDAGTVDINLSGEVDGGVLLDWETASSFEKFVVTNRGEVLTETSDLSFEILNPFPQEFELRVAGHIPGDGYFFSEVLNLNVEGGVEKGAVIFEAGTGTWCVNCPSSARGLQQMVDEGLKVGVLKYHSGDSYSNDFAADRIDYYQMTGFPTVLAEGQTRWIGGSQFGSRYSTYQPFYADRIANRRAMYSLDIQTILEENGEYHMTIRGSREYDYYEGRISLQVALIESHIPESWFGLTEVNDVVREMYPNADGVPISTGDQFTETRQFAVNDAYNLDNVEVVVFLQHEATKEIINAEVVKLSEIVTSSERTELQNIVVSPVPFGDFMTIKGVENAQARIVNMQGQVIHRFQINSNIHHEYTSFMPSGNAILHIENTDGVFTKRISKL